MSCYLNMKYRVRHDNIVIFNILINSSVKSAPRAYMLIMAKMSSLNSTVLNYSNVYLRVLFIVLNVQLHFLNIYVYIGLCVSFKF